MRNDLSAIVLKAWPGEKPMKRVFVGGVFRGAIAKDTGGWRPDPGGPMDVCPTELLAARRLLDRRGIPYRTD